MTLIILTFSVCMLVFLAVIEYAVSHAVENHDAHEWHDDEYPHPEPRAK